MKNREIKGNRRKTLSIVLLLLFTAVGCTKNFEDLNTNPSGVSDGEANADYAQLTAFLAQGQWCIIPDIFGPGGSYQLTNNLTSDGYAGYFGLPAPFAGSSNTLNYNIVPGWIANTSARYVDAMNPLYKLEGQTRNDKAQEDIFAFAKLLKVSVMHRMSDRFGPIIYSKYNSLNAAGGIDYDSEQDLFKQYFQDLDTVADILRGISGNATSPAMAIADLGYGKDNYAHHLKIANTLRLRLAMRIALVDPAEAKTQGEKALDPASGGLLENTADNWSVSLPSDHPLNTLTNDWTDTRMHASMESFLMGYNDPRLEKHWLPATAPSSVAGQYKGIRTGINISAKDDYVGFSKLRPLENRMQLMVASEAWFLKAEAALRGWANAGDAKVNYETGVRSSFAMHGLTETEATAYLADATKTAAPYTDPVNPAEHDIPAGSPLLSTITIAWNDAADNNEKLERIITQKWLAIFPDGDEAWAEYRRTGYPKLFPVVKNDSNGAIPSVPGIRRLPFMNNEYNSNRAAVEAAIVMLGGPDNGGTRLWWDVENKGF